MNTLDALDAKSLRSDVPDFRPGDTLKVHVRVIEGSRQRVQIFQGAVIRRQGGGVRETFTVRKMSFGVRFSGSARSKNIFRRAPPSDGQSSFNNASHRSLIYGSIVQFTKPTRSDD